MFFHFIVIYFNAKIQKNIQINNNPLSFLYKPFNGKNIKGSYGKEKSWKNILPA